MSASNKAVFKAIEMSVHAAIKELGVDAVRSMSMFPSAQKKHAKRAA